jgi:hypothetical protein
MERDQTLQFTPVEHPDPRIQRVGFDLDNPYVEQCWSAVIGPSSTLLLRRITAMWFERVPAQIGASELAQSLGLGAGVTERSRFVNTLNRIVNYRLARPAPEGAGLEVFRQVSPLTPRQLDRVPQWTRDTHNRLLGAHIERIDDLAQHQANAASITARLDRIQNGAVQPTISATPSQPVSHRQGLWR